MSSLGDGDSRAGGVEGGAEAAAIGGTVVENPMRRSSGSSRRPTTFGPLAKPTPWTTRLGLPQILGGLRNPAGEMEARGGCQPAESPQDWLRRHVVQHPAFDGLILLCIAANSITLAFANPLLSPESSLARGLEVSDLVFNVIFVIEMVTKMIALSLCPPLSRDSCRLCNKESSVDNPDSSSETASASGSEKHRDTTKAVPNPLSALPDDAELEGGSSGIERGSSRRQEDGKPYFANPWNWLDFVIVVSAIVGYLPGMGGAATSGIRLIRVLRPLRSINRLPALKVIVNTMIDSLSGLLAATILVFFLWLVYGIIGLQLFSGVLHQRCFPVDELPLPLPPPFLELDDPYSLSGFCGAQVCGPNTTCLSRATDPAWGTASFDNIGLAFLTIYEVMSLSNWAMIAYQVMDTAGGASIAYFVSLILFGTFFALNIVLAVIVESYENNFEKQQVIEAAERARTFFSSSSDKQERMVEILDEARRQGTLRFGIEALLPPPPTVLAAATDSEDDSAAETSDAEHRPPRSATPPFDMDSQSDSSARASSSSLPSAHGSSRASTAPSVDEARVPEVFKAATPVGAAARQGLHRIMTGRSTLTRRQILNQFEALIHDAVSAHLDAAMKRSASPQSASGDDDDDDDDSDATSFDEENEEDSRAPSVRKMRSSVTRSSRTSSATSRRAARGGVVGSQRSPSRNSGRKPWSRVSSRSTAARPAPSPLRIEVHSPAGGEERAAEAVPAAMILPPDSHGVSPERQAVESANVATLLEDSGTSALSASRSEIELSPIPLASHGAAAAAPPLEFDPPGTVHAKEDESVSLPDAETDDETMNEELQLRRIQRVMRDDDRLRERWAAAARTTLVASDRLDRRQRWLTGKHPCFHSISGVARGPVVSGIVIAAILVNTVVLAMDHYGIHAATVATLDIINVVLTAIFAAEMVLKIVGLGPFEYVMDTMNVFDALVVLISLVEIIVAAASSGGGSSVVGVFRTFRLLRVLKLAKSIKPLRVLLMTMMESLPDIGWMSLVLLLFVYIFAVLGMQLFAGKLSSLPTGEASVNFDDMFQSVFAVFQVLTADDWTIAMADASRATSSAAISYFVALHALGSYVILALFVAILLQRFSNQSESAFDDEDYVELGVELLAKQAAEFERECGFAADRVRELGVPVNTCAAIVQEMEVRAKQRQEAAQLKKARHTQRARSPGVYFDKETRSEVFEGMEGKFCGCLASDHPARKLIFRLVTSWAFEGCILILILVNCVLLALERPSLDPRSELAIAMEKTDIVFASLFTAEAILKIAAFGALGSRHAYLRSSWNVLDLFIVMMSLLALGLPQVAMLRSLRALRPLRIIVRSQQIQVVIRALVFALPNIFNVFMMTMLIWLIFAILGVNLFKGGLGYCTLDMQLSQAACLLAANASTNGSASTSSVWATPEANFDDVGTAIMTLLRVATLSGWATVARSAIDSAGPGQAPIPGNSPAVLVYFVAFIIVGSFFSLNLFIGVVIDNFNRLKKEFDGSAFMTKEQRQWANANRLIQSVQLKTKARKPESLLRRLAYDAVTWPWFDSIIFAAIIGNTLVMALQYYGQSAKWTEVLDALNTSFTAVFALEAALKIAGTGFVVYWRESWNRFDLFVVLASIVGIFAAAGPGASVIRVLRIMRVVRLARAKILRSLLSTLISSLPSLWNIGGLLFVLFFIFAVLGTNLFGLTPLGEESDFGVSRQANFGDFGMSLLTLWRVATGDAWENIMYDTMRTSSGLAVVFFVLFQVFVSFVMINLFIAVILENFSDSMEKDTTGWQQAKIQAWSEVWNEYDPLALKWVPVALFPRLQSEAPRPFGFGTRFMSPFAVVDRLARMRVPIYRKAVSIFAGATGAHILREARAVSGLHSLAQGQSLSLESGSNVTRSTTRNGRPVDRQSSRRIVSSGTESHRLPERRASSLQTSSRLDLLPRQVQRGEREVWCVEFQSTLKALAAVAIKLDVDLERSEGQFYAHEWLVVRMVEELAWPRFAARRRDQS